MYAGYPDGVSIQFPERKTRLKTDAERPGWFQTPTASFRDSTGRTRLCLNGRGPVPARVVFVDKAPETEEILAAPPSGERVSGPQGYGAYTSRKARMLLAMMKQVGFDLSEARFTYATHHAPRKLDSAEVRWGETMFREEIAASEPEVVVCLGADPLKAVVGNSYSWEDVHGAFFVPDSIPNCPFQVFATFNLEQVLYGPKWDRHMLRDLNLVRSRLDGTETLPPPCRNRVIHTPYEVKMFADFIETSGKRTIMLDCEWNGKNWMDPDRYFRTIQIGYARGRVATVEISTEGGVRCDDEKEVLAQVKRVLESPNVSIVGHNVISDGEWLLSYGIDIRPRVVYDTMLAEHIIDQNGPFGLETLAMKYTPYGRYSVDVEVWVRRHKNENLPDTSANGYGYVPRDMLLNYGFVDVDVLHYIMDKQIPILRERGCFKPRGANGEYPSLFQTVMNTQRVTYDLERNGLPVDVDQLDMLTEKYQAKKAELAQKIGMMAENLGMPVFNPNSTAQLRKLLFDRKYLGLNPVKTTSGDDWGDAVGDEGMDSDEDPPSATDKATLQILEANEGINPIVPALLDYKRVNQACKTWLTKYKTTPNDMSEDGSNGEPAGLYKDIWPDGTLKSRFSVLTETGRYRTSVPNSQNWPKKAEGFLTRIFGKGNEPPMLRTVVDPMKRIENIRDGRKWVQIEGDFVQAELFCMANLTGDAEMIKALTTPGMDLHDKTTVDSFGFHMYDENGHEVSEDDLVSLAAKVGVDSEDYEHFMKTLVYVDAHNNRLTRAQFRGGPRISGKAINFGIPLILAELKPCELQETPKWTTCSQAVKTEGSETIPKGSRFGGITESKCRVLDYSGSSSDIVRPRRQRRESHARMARNTCDGRGAKAIALQIKAETGDSRSIDEIANEVSKVLESWKTRTFVTCWNTLHGWSQLLYSQGYIENPWGMRKHGYVRKGKTDASLERQFQNFP